MKENILIDEAIVTGDFAENYSFVVQDATQIFHWTIDQVMLHPIVIYHLNADCKVNHKSYCVISDSLDHCTTTVYTFQQKLMKIIKQNFPTQHKNRFNFMNLCYHENDFEEKT